ncbi:MAG: hypothetical protein ACR2PA_12795 [Hyphomicrobiaceae bacterium]
MKTTNKVHSGLIAAGIFLLSATVTSLANARPVCGPRDQALRQLEHHHSEQVFGRGLAPDGTAMMELFVSKSGSWTVLVSRPDGRSCIIAAGESWHQIKPLVGNPA